jgi:hypothetical protein
MNTRQIVLAGIVIIALLSTTGTVVASGADPVAAQVPDPLPIGPGNPLFGLQVAMENLDETFTVNDTRRMEKQLDHAQARINELQQELQLNETGYADQALELYREKLNQTEAVLPRFPVNATGLLKAQETIARHQVVLFDLMSRYPGNPGLARAYNNSQVLEQKFGEKTHVKFDRVAGKNNTTALKAVKLETGKQNNTGDSSGGNPGQGGNDTRDRVKDKKTEIPATPAVTAVLTIPDDDKGSLKDQGKKGSKY